MICVMSFRNRIVLYLGMEQAQPQFEVHAQYATGSLRLRMEKGVVDICCTRP